MSPNREFITIVSGLPRSGTSMMMQMLEAGGLPVCTDGVRSADLDNPRGYYEFEPVKEVRRDCSWLNQARGKATKMVYRLLYDLPTGYEYRILFLQRDLREVLASQRAMLTRHAKKGGSLDDSQLGTVFATELRKFREWIGAQECFSVLWVNYSNVVNNPGPEAEAVSQFLGGGLDTRAMANVVDPLLYRNRA